MQRLWVLFPLLVLSTACSKPKVDRSNSPQFVDSASVQSILIASEEWSFDACRQEIQSSGGKVLYQNNLGVFMTDAKAASLHLKECKAMVTDNTLLPAAPPAATESSPQNDLSALLRLIPAEEIGARSFVQSHPHYDGRGVIIAILDTGIELDHPVLNKTPDGSFKTLDFQDFSGEGRVTLTAIAKDQDGSVKTPNGNYQAKTVEGSDFRWGTFKGSSLSYSSGLSSNDTFSDVAVLAYKNAAGDWRARVDTNNDSNFDDETELYDFRESRLFTKLGAKKSLTVSVTIATSGNTLTLNFDDGSHGTHVAGIAAGYDPKGMQGVAPGAQIVLGKIGDNRIPGGPTSTSSIMLAIDFAVQSKAQIVNMSYGASPGSNLGTSAVDQYVDRVAKERGILFSISGGNDGPGLLTVGVPGGANLAITNGAYLSRKTAADNYGWIGLEQDGMWFFSSVGPRLDGGWKPTLLAPGTALSSVPKWSGNFGNYSGTSMASPETTGGLALLLSAAQQQKLLTDRASVTRAVYDSAKRLEGISLIEQGHGLFNVPAAFTKLSQMKSRPTEFTLSVTNPVSPTGTGGGIFVRGRRLPENNFSVSVSPVIEDSASKADLPLRTLKLVPSANWIRLPEELWIQSTPRSFQVRLDPAVLSQPGLHSEVITAVDNQSGEVAFEVPVTVVAPYTLDDVNQHTFTANDTAHVGKTLRYFLDIPSGTTSLSIELSSDGPAISGQLLDPEGKTVTALKDSTTSSPLPPLSVATNISRAGVYEFDVVASPALSSPGKIQLKIKAYSLSIALGPEEEPQKFTAFVQNNFEPIKVVPSISLNAVRSQRTILVKGSGTQLPISLSEEDRKLFSGVTLKFVTAKSTYDLMTDFPYRVLDSQGAAVTSGGLDMNSTVGFANLDKLPGGDLSLEVSGSFTTEAPNHWSFTLTESRLLINPVNMGTSSRFSLETGQQKGIAIDLNSIQNPLAKGFDNCATLSLADPNGKVLQTTPLCR